MIFTGSIIYDLLAILTTGIIGILLYYRWKFSYWTRIGVPSLNPSFPFGDGKYMLLGQTTFGEQFRDFYFDFKSRGFKHGGIFFCLQQFYLPVDPQIIKHIMQKDFSHFVNHGNYSNEKNDPLSAQLFNMEDTKWKNMRAKLTPTFTSGKMKMMFQTLADCTVPLKDLMDEVAVKGESVEIKDVLARFTTDIIGSAAFGIECNTLKKPDAEFIKYGRRIFEFDTVMKLKIMLQVMFPHSLLKALKVKTTSSDVERFFIKLIRDTVEYREKNNIYRKDFMHLLIQLKNRGVVADDDKLVDETGKTEEKALTMNELAAQAYVFFVAGFETSSTTMTFTLYEIATNPDVQDQLRREIKTVLARHADQMTYAAMMEMTYMEKVLQETLRKYPPFPVLNRKCNKDYTIPGTTIRLKTGDMIGISALGVHSDPEYYPNPEKFDPERFSEENKNARPEFTWLPFGEGPRQCIGIRFGILQSKVGLTALLKNYKITLNSKTKIPLQMDKTSFISSVEGGVWLNVEKLT